MLCTGFIAASLYIVLLGYQPVTALAQEQDISDVTTRLTDADLVDAGTVVSSEPDSVAVKNDSFTRVFRINAQTKILRVDSSPLQVGDQVAGRCHFDNKGAAVADSIEANVDRWEGVITKVLNGTVYIKFDPPVKGTAKVIFDRKTEFGYCAGDDPGRECTADDLKVGRHLETTGFVLGKNELRAIRVLGIRKH